MLYLNPTGGGYSLDSKSYRATYYTDGITCLAPQCDMDTVPNILLGHNINFDLLWARREALEVVPGLSLREWHGLGGRVMDTQYIEYLWSGQRTQYARLDNLIEKYVGSASMKDDKMKKYWDAGWETEAIPKEELLDYMHNDVIQTANVFRAQHREIRRSEYHTLWNLIEAHAGALYAYNEIEWNGLYLDSDLFNANKKRLSTERTMLRKRLYELTVALLKAGKVTPGIPHKIPDTHEYGWATAHHVDPDRVMGPRMISAVLFGGCIQVSRGKKLIGKYKNGNDKYKSHDYFAYSSGVFSPSALDDYAAPSPKAKLRKGMLGKAYPVRATDSTSLGKLLAASPYRSSRKPHLFSPLHPTGTSVLVEEYIKIILDLRGIDKEWSSYFKTIPALLGPDGVIHPKLNNTSTGTGRLSSSKINSQNIINGGYGDLKSCFVSRYVYGLIGEIDYSSLEFRGMAYTSGDKVMYDTLNSGSDVHYETGKAAFGYTCKADETKDKRRDVKGTVFGTIFGGGAVTIAWQTGISINTVKEIQKAFKATYWEMYETQDKEFRHANNELTKFIRDGACALDIRQVPGLTTEKGYNVYELRTQQPTGRILTYRSYDSPDWSSRTIGFSPTEFKNYKVQSISTGDIVPMALGVVSTTLDNRFPTDGVKLVNTVHDSIMIDAANRELADSAIPMVARVMAKAPAIFQYFFKREFDLNLPVEATYGPSWKDQSLSKEEYL